MIPAQEAKHLRLMITIIIIIIIIIIKWETPFVLYLISTHLDLISTSRMLDHLENKPFKYTFMSTKFAVPAFSFTLLMQFIALLVQTTKLFIGSPWFQSINKIQKGWKKFLIQHYLFLRLKDMESKSLILSDVSFNNWSSIWKREEFKLKESWGRGVKEPLCFIYYLFSNN